MTFDGICTYENLFNKDFLDYVIQVINRIVLMNTQDSGKLTLDAVMAKIAFS